MTRLTNVPASALPEPRPAVLQAKAELAQAVGGRVSTEAIDRLSYARDMWPLALLWIRQGRLPSPPDAVVWPGNADEVSQVVALARRRRFALIPYGAGSGVCGGTWAVQGGVTLDLKRLDSISAVDVARRQVTVGAGVMGETLERRLNAHGWTLGHFPSSMATSTVGGWLATRSAGQFSSKYGKIEDMTLSVSAVLGTGEVLHTPQRPLSGPDPLGLMLGSEGTLATFTSATLRVFPSPKGRVFHGFEFGSLEKGLDTIRLLFREGLRPAVVRLYDPFDTALVGKGGATRAPMPPSRRGFFATAVMPAVLRQVTKRTLGRPALLKPLQRAFSKSRLILMFEGDAADAEADDRAATALCRQLGASDLGEGPGREWFHKRYDVGFRMSRLIESGAFVDTMEIAAPWDRVLDVYARVHATASAFALVLCHFSHAYPEGCSLYFSFVGSGASEREMEERYHHLWRAALAAATGAGGNVSHHHGVGLLKARALQDHLGEGRHALRAVKEIFDPDGVMNPGKLGL
jgi:alkyldihydroxyacetonephosphate synthase